MRAENFETRENLEINLKAKDNAYVDMKPKTFKFWLKKDNRWNEPSFASEKIFKFHHKFHDKYTKSQSNQPSSQICKQKNKYLYNKQEDYKLFVKTKKKEAKQRLEDRKKERILLQQESMQLVMGADQLEKIQQKVKNLTYEEKRKLIIKRSAARTMLKKKPDNLWNDFNNKCDKLLDLYLRPIMLENEDKAVELMQKKIKKKQKANFYKGLYKKVKHDVIRYRARKSKSEPKRRENSSSRGWEIKKPYMYFYKKRMRGLMKDKDGDAVLENTVVGDNTWNNRMKDLSGSVYERLSQQKTNKIRSFDIEYFDEFKDMMIRDVTPQTAYFDNNYIKTLVKISKTAKKRTRKRRSITVGRLERKGSYEKENSIIERKKNLSMKRKRRIEGMRLHKLNNEKKNTFSEINQFEKKFNFSKGGVRDEKKFRLNHDISEIRGENTLKSGLFSNTEDVVELLPFINQDSIIEAKNVAFKKGKIPPIRSFSEMS